MTIKPQFIEELNRALNLRRVAEGTGFLDQNEAAWTLLRPRDTHVTEFLLLLAQWVDIGYRDHHVLDALLSKIPATAQRKLPMEDYMRLQAVHGFRALSADEPDAAIKRLDFVLQSEPGATEEHLAMLAHFWKGRAHRKKGEYELSLQETKFARSLAQKDPGNELLSAVIQIHEAWLVFQMGTTLPTRKEALRLLALSEADLKTTDDRVALGNIESARGRIVRRLGEYKKALGYFDRAISIYSDGNPNHLNLARARVNAAYTKRLLALQIRRKIDARAQNTGLRELRDLHKQYSDDAMAQLERAREIYQWHHHSVGLGTVIVNIGNLHLDLGNIDLAANAASEAYRIGDEKKHQILMARARVLHAATENAIVQDPIDGVDIAQNANLAKEYSEHALELAKHTQYRSLIAEAFIARGMTAANDFFNDWELAKECAGKAGNFLGAGENNYLVDDLATLKSQIMQASGINDSLREWSAGTVRGKTLNQIIKEFTEIVVTQVWEHEDKKIARVAMCLSTHPRKVRNILRKNGLLGKRTEKPTGNAVW
jgi:tetratricopeptide (TPR) repeat protein